MNFKKILRDVLADQPALVMAFVGVVFAILLLVVAAWALALEPGHYAIDDRIGGPGEGAGAGLNIECQADGLCMAIWYNYLETPTVVDTSTHQGQVWLFADPLCPQGLGECAVSWHLTTGSWNGRLTPFEFSSPVGASILNQTDAKTIEHDFEVLRLRPDSCNIGSGGLILAECVGDVTMKRIVGEDR